MTVSFSADQYAEIKKAACPYCAYGLPDVRESEKWFHTIPETHFKEACWANRLREKLAPSMGSGLP